MTTQNLWAATMPAVAILGFITPSMKRKLQRVIRRLPILVVPLLVAACGTFPLSGNTYGPGKTQDQHQMDILVCKDQAKLAANTTGRQTGAFLLGMTIIGAPVAFELEKAKQREVFAQCMTARGYTVMPVEGQQKQAAAAQRPVVLATDIGAKKNEDTGLSVKDDAAQLEKLKVLKDRALITEEEYNRKKNEILDRI